MGSVIRVVLGLSETAPTSPTVIVGDATINGKVSIRRGSWFDHSKLTMGQVLELTYFWVKELPNKTTEEECAISNKSIVDWYNFCREVCATIIEEESTQIGGVGEVVEIDESKFGKRKYHKGRRVDGVWVFGGIDRRTRQCFLVTVEDRSEATLIPIIQKYIKPGTTIMSDCWKAYTKLEQLGYKHGTVNHSVEFVNSATGDHTQTIESTWRSVKGSLPRYGTQKHFYESYFAEYLFRHKYFTPDSDKFLTFLDKIKNVYTSTHRLISPLSDPSRHS